MSDPSTDYDIEATISVDDFLSSRQGKFGRSLERYNAATEGQAYEAISNAISDADKRVTVNAHYSESDTAVSGIFSNPAHGEGITASYLLELVDRAGSLEDAIKSYAPELEEFGDIDGFQIVIHG